jgi:glycerol transport system ATP-binding protein
MRVARAFSDPPMNLAAGRRASHGVSLADGVALELSLPATSTPMLTVGIRASALHVRGSGGDVALPATVELAEISGSDTFVHAATPIGDVVAQLTGVHQFALGATVTLYLDPATVYVFDANGDLLVAPATGG